MRNAAPSIYRTSDLPRNGNGHGNGRHAAPAVDPGAFRLPDASRPVLITGGAGFVGVNVASRLLEAGHDVIVFDNLSRHGVDRNLAWLRDRYPRVRFIQGDIRDGAAVRDAVQQAGFIFHFAAQVAVTTSLVDPREDFEINLQGTMNVLEAARSQPTPPPMLFTSTNKVYGDLHGLHVEDEGSRYCPTHYAVRAHGFAEGWLDFHSPYGCSKGAADQYVLDYARSYDLPAVVFRMSCIYGPHQCGNEDQGWVAHFLLQAMRGETITLYGDGKQVRDVLFVEDLVRAMVLALGHVDQTAGEPFNLGGGPANAVSLIEMLELIGKVRGEPVDYTFGDWRRGDQKYFVADTGKFERVTGWTPAVGVEEGVTRLHRWLTEHVGASMEMTV